MSDEVPETLQRPEVLVVAAVLFLCEAVADKIPYVDSVWDTVHTVVRPVAGAGSARCSPGRAVRSPRSRPAAIGGSTALASHAVKAGTRMAVNTSPEPFSNIGVSLAEDLGVAGIVTFAIFHPVAAAIVAGAAAARPGVVLVFLRLADPPVPAAQGAAARGTRGSRAAPVAAAARLTASAVGGGR